jgi:hypothetical protein
MEPEFQVAADGADQMADLERLEWSLPDLRRDSDLEGLLRLQAQAEAISTVSRGRARRRAKRITSEASWAVHEIRRRGGETRLEHETRMARASRESNWLRREAEAKLMGRLVKLLHLLLYEGSPVASDIAPLDSLAATDPEGFLRVEIPEGVRPESGLLLDGFERGSRIFAAAGVRDRKANPELALKAIAVALVAAGAEVRDLSNDAVPLIAYSLFMKELPVALKSPDKVAENINDLVLSVADDVSTVPASARPILIGLFRLALLLGEAQAYAERYSVTVVSQSVGPVDLERD